VSVTISEAANADAIGSIQTKMTASTAVSLFIYASTVFAFLS
jgi:hypothetical protein